MSFYHATKRPVFVATMESESIKYKRYQLLKQRNCFYKQEDFVWAFFTPNKLSVIHHSIANVHTNSRIPGNKF